MPSALSRNKKITRFNPGSNDLYRCWFGGVKLCKRLRRWKVGQGRRQRFPDRRATVRTPNPWVAKSINGSFVNRIKSRNSFRTSRGALGSKCQLFISSTKNSLSIKFGLVVIIEINPFPTLVVVITLILCGSTIEFNGGIQIKFATTVTTVN